MLVGVISDTHGLLRPEAVAALCGVDCIIHAGDIGGSEVLDGLALIAPVYAIRGNNDREEWAADLPQARTIELAGVSVFVIHDLNQLMREQRERPMRVVVSGHSHVPKAREADGILYLNPGSAGPRRFRLPITVAHLKLTRKKAHAKLIELDLP